MNTLSKVIQCLESPELKDFIHRMDLIQKQSKKLKYGFETSLTKKDTHLAKQMNSIYQGLVWGHLNNADNNTVCTDEKRVIKKFISNTVYSQHALEVGAGSGRVSKFLAHTCKKLTLLDSNQAIINVCKNTVKINTGNIFFKVQDFSKDCSSMYNKFSSILLFENLIGMNPVDTDRRNIFKNIDRCLMKSGIAVVAFRYRSDILYDFKTQVMPYDVKLKNKVYKLYGFSINWSLEQVEHEAVQMKSNFELIEVIKGISRPAGGRMAFAVLRKL